jgi:hypothetical protein
MTLRDSTIEQTTFRQGDSSNAHFYKLEKLRRAVVAAGATVRTLRLSITDGLPEADPDEPLIRFRLGADENWTIGDITADAGDAATGTVAFRFKKDGVDNGEIEFTGAAGTATDVEPYGPGDLFELYPPLVADATLDDVSISIPVTVS